MIPYGRQEITPADIDAVVEVLKSDFITQGPLVPRFERAMADYCGAKYAVAVNSATSALHIACLALDLGSGDWLWTSPITFVASANCGLYCGAQVDFVDIDPRTYNMSVSALECKLEVAKADGKLPKVVVPVHLCGQSCDMVAIHELSQRYGFKVLEDASHSVGGKYCGEPIGNGHYSDITVFSFHPVKIITTAEGGLALTNNSFLADRMDILRSHGITRDLEKMTREPDGPWFYQQVELGFNYRMSDIQATLGLSQLNRLDKYVTERHRLAERYDEHLSECPVVTPWQHPNRYSALHLYVIRVKSAELRPSHRQIFESLRQQGIGVNLHYVPVHFHPYYADMGFVVGDFPHSEAYYGEAISLPMFPTMSEAQQDKVIAALRKALAE